MHRSKLTAVALFAALFGIALGAGDKIANVGYVKVTDGTNVISFDASGNIYTREGHQANLIAAANGAAQANNVTLAGAANITTYITGFTITGLGATSGSTIAVTITGTASATTPTYYLTIPAGATVAVTPLNILFDKPIPASAVNTSIVVNVPSFGTGNTTAGVVATGFRQ